MDAAAAYVVVVLENTRLVEQLQSSLRDLSESRGRIVAVADESRLRIERDLHDGAQQRLIGLRIQLSMQSEHLRVASPRAAAKLDQLGREVEQTIDEIRDLAQGIYPVLLEERGLPEALRAAARRAPIHTRVEADGVGRYRREVESTVYFACLESLQNAIKHADGATGVAIALRDGDDLAFEVRDDGSGFDAWSAPRAGIGLTNMRDRVTALGGTISIESSPGEGTRVAGAVPVSVGPGTA
jgi:signal transduction histidine kinase